jgi:phage repressor protein C with HTH and peptisase S24 domain
LAGYIPFVVVCFPPMSTQGDRLRRARIAAGFQSASDAAARHGWSVNTFKSNENGNAPFSFRKAKEYGHAFGVRPEWLYDGTGAMRASGYVPVIGRAGANPDGSVLFATGQESGEVVPIPPGGTEKAVALKVIGHSMRGLADDGALIYFEDQRTPPTPEMIGQIVVVETEDDEVLVKRLLRGSAPGLWDLESLAGPLMRDVKLRWASLITAIVPPYVAQRIVVRAEDAA